MNQILTDQPLSWQELSTLYECPEWFRDAKFGIWAHWGVQTVPEIGGGWYAKHLYRTDVDKQTWGDNAYPYHCETYGHPSRFGYKDLCNLWRGEKFDAPSMLCQWKDWGARYAAILCNHHDAFDNWNSIDYDWNAVNVGPKRDIVGEFSQAARSLGLPWVATIHDVDWARDFLVGAYSADEQGPLKGIPYDGIMTKNDGKGLWWEGLDPRQLYGPPPQERDEEWKRRDNQAWLKRHLQLIRDYLPDAIYFDSRNIPYGQEGEKLCAEYYLESLHKNNSIQTIVQVKSPQPGTMYDIERGGSEILRKDPWQADTTLANAWFLKYDKPHWHNARTVIETLCDVVSKNGNLLLNLGIFPDGTLPEDQHREMERIGKWLRENGEAIYGSRPWVVCRDGSGMQFPPSSRTVDTVNSEFMKKAQKEKQGHFNERTVSSPPYHHNEVRFTVRQGQLYVLALNPAPGYLRIPALGKNTPANPKIIVGATLLANGDKLSCRQEQDALYLELPEGIEQCMPLAIAILSDRLHFDYHM